MNQYDLYSIYDRPVPYKTLQIYPALVSDYLYFHFFIGCLTLDKNSIPDPKIISMTYLEYIYFSSTEEENWLFKFDALMKIVTRKPELKITYGYNENRKPIFTIDNMVFDSNDFEEIKKIIVSQNLIEHLVPDETISKEVRDKLEEAQRFRDRKNGYKMASLEDQLICVLISTPLKLEDIYNLTIRKFTKIIQRVDQKLHYEIYMTAAVSGFVEFKNKDVLKHWMADTSKDDRYADVKINPDSLRKKVSLEDKKGKEKN